MKGIIALFFLGVIFSSVSGRLLEIGNYLVYKISATEITTGNVSFQGTIKYLVSREVKRGADSLPLFELEPSEYSPIISARPMYYFYDKDFNIWKTELNGILTEKLVVQNRYYFGQNWQSMYIKQSVSPRTLITSFDTTYSSDFVVAENQIAKIGAESHSDCFLISYWEHSKPNDTLNADWKTTYIAKNSLGSIYSSDTSNDLISTTELIDYLIQNPVQIKVLNNVKKVLDQNFAVFPNPFKTRLNFDLPSGIKAIEIYDAKGRRMRNLFSGLGFWDGRDNNGFRVPPGVYLIKVKAGGQVYSRKVVLNR